MSSDWLEETQMKKLLEQWMQDKKQEKCYWTMRCDHVKMAVGTHTWCCEDGTCKQAHTRFITENEKVYIKINVCPFFPHDISFLFVKLMRSSVFICCFSLLDDHYKVLWINVCISEPKQGFCVFITTSFHHGGGYKRVWLTLETKKCKGLPRTMVVQGSMWCSCITNTHLNIITLQTSICVS